jgi:hypothetical protein
MSETFDKDTKKIYDHIDKFVNLNVSPDQSEQLVYALAQILHERIGMADIQDFEKGLMVSQLIENFADFNKEALAEYREIRLASLESKDQTKH